MADFNARVDDEGAPQELTLTGPTEQVRSLFARSLPDLFGEPLVIVPEAK